MTYRKMSPTGRGSVKNGRERAALPSSPKEVGARRGVRSVQLLRPLSEIVRRTGGFNRKAWRLLADYWTVSGSGRFDAAFYLERNPDVAASGIDPLLHYLVHGEAEGRRPSAELSAMRLHSMEFHVRRKRNRLAELIRMERGPLFGWIAEWRITAASADPSEAKFQLPAVTPRSTRPRKRLVVYTAIFDDYDKLVPVPGGHDAVDYVCFSDRNFAHPGPWEVRALDFHHASPRRIARYAKLHPHRYFQDYEWSLWVDGRIGLLINPLELLEPLERQGNFFAFHHPERSTPYKEAEEVKRLQLDEEARVDRQMERYRQQGFPLDSRLHETGVLLRKHMSDRVIAHSRIWWSEIEGGSVRDQLSVDYAAWRSQLDLKELAPRDLNVRNDERFSISTHRTLLRAASSWSTGHAAKLSPPLVVDFPGGADAARPMDIIVCVHNALPDVMNCLASVQVSMSGRERLIIVDDGSAAETRDWLAANIVSRFPGADLIRRDQAAGYTVAANIGLRASSAPDVMLLNSDTVVPRSWLKKLRRALDTSAEAGLAGPLSNAATYQSIPEVESASGGFSINALPKGMSVDAMDAMCERLAAGLYPRVSSLNGFCMLVRRTVIETIGFFDEATFPKGYGEENDYCFRAADCGLSSVIACDTYVFHAKSKSYTTRGRNELARAGGVALRAKWPDSRVQACALSLEAHPWLAAIRAKSAALLAETGNA
jgi:O-antigen biosynthesis protein